MHFLPTWQQMDEPLETFCDCGQAYFKEINLTQNPSPVVQNKIKKDWNYFCLFLKNFIC